MTILSCLKCLYQFLIILRKNWIFLNGSGTHPLFLLVGPLKKKKTWVFLPTIWVRKLHLSDLTLTGHCCGSKRMDQHKSTFASSDTSQNPSWRLISGRGLIPNSQVRGLRVGRLGLRVLGSVLGYKVLNVVFRWCSLFYDLIIICNQICVT